MWGWLGLRVLALILAAVGLVACTAQDPDGAAATDPGGTEDDPSRSPSARAGSDKLLNDVPEDCLEPTPVRDEQLVAGYANGRVTVASVAGRRVTSFAARSPVAFSASGRYIATGGGILHTSNGKRAGRLFPSLVFWAWSPISDCAFVADHRGLWVTRLGDDPILLVRRVAFPTWSISPDGRRASFVTSGADDKPYLHVADLETGTIERRERLPGKGGIAPAGWTSDGVHPMWWRYSDVTRADAEGATLHAGPQRYESVVAIPDFVRSCPEYVVAIVSESLRFDVATLRSGTSETDVVGSPAGLYVFPECGPRGDVVAIDVDSRFKRGRLVVISAESLRKEGPVGTPTGMLDTYPRMASENGGLVFVRGRRGASRVLIWYMDELGRTRSTGVTVVSPGPFSPLFLQGRRVLDWTGDRPPGLTYDPPILTDI